MRVLFKTLAVLFVITVPVTAICASANVVMRMPDVYQYEFKSTNALNSFGLEKSDDEMGEFISDFMMGKEKEFQIWVGDEEKPQAVFNEGEVAAASRARLITNVIAVFGAVSAVGMAASFIVLKRNDFNREIRIQFKKSTAVYAVMVIIYLAGLFVMYNMGYTFSDILGYVPAEGDLAPQIITAGLMRKVYIMIAAISALLMGLIGYFVFKVTEPKKIFSREY